MRTHLLISLLIIGGVIAAASSYSAPQAPRKYRAAHQHQHTDSGAVKGQVLDLEGKPVANAEVLALRNESGTGKVPTAYSDKQGLFLIERLTPGSYTISASKREVGYPPTDSPFYAAGFVESPQVTVDEGQTISGITVSFGSKAARLAGHFIDATSNRRLKNLEGVRLTLRRVDRPALSYVEAPNVWGAYSVLVPPVPFTIEVSAPSYGKWNNGGEAIRLTPGAVKNLTIPLRPSR